jgi:hypothetical protein
MVTPRYLTVEEGATVRPATVISTVTRWARGILSGFLRYLLVDERPRISSDLRGARESLRCCARSVCSSVLIQGVSVGNVCRVRDKVKRKKKRKRLSFSVANLSRYIGFGNPYPPVRVAKPSHVLPSLPHVAPSHVLSGCPSKLNMSHDNPTKNRKKSIAPALQVNQSSSQNKSSSS